MTVAVVEAQASHGFAAPSRARILVGDVRGVLATLPAGSVHCVVTSPPYWALRAYGTEPQVWGQTCCTHPHEWGEPVAGDSKGGSGTPTNKNGRGEMYARGAERGAFCTHVHDWQTVTRPAANGIQNSAMQGETMNGQSATRKPTSSLSCGCGAWYGELGGEPTPELYVQNIVEVMRAVRRVLRKDGTLWLNLGFSYAGSGKGPSNALEREASQIGPSAQKKRNPAQFANGQAPTEWVSVPRGYKPKDLIPIPFLVAMAMQADGWYWRSTIAWCKKVPMPEHADRPVSAWEPIMLFSRSRRYFYDSEAVRENGTPEQDAHNQRYARPYATFDDHADRKQPGGVNNVGIHSRPGQGGHNMWNYWLLGPEPFAEAHFAVFPSEIPRRCIAAGTSEKGCCPVCGAPWARVVEKSGETPRQRAARDGLGPYAVAYDAANPNALNFSGSHWKLPARSSETTDWRPTCTHEAPLVPATVLDPFAGAGTSLMVAARMGRDSIGVELKPEYAYMAEQRIRLDGGFTVDVGVEVVA